MGVAPIGGKRAFVVGRGLISAQMIGGRLISAPTEYPETRLSLRRGRSQTGLRAHNCAPLRLKPGMLVWQTQAQKRNRTSPNFLPAQAPSGAGRNGTQALLICAPEGFCLLQGVTPVMGVQGVCGNGGGRRRPNRRLHTPLGGSLVTFWPSRKSLAAEAAKFPVKNSNPPVTIPKQNRLIGERSKKKHRKEAAGMDDVIALFHRTRTRSTAWPCPLPAPPPTRRT